MPTPLPPHPPAWHLQVVSCGEWWQADQGSRWMRMVEVAIEREWGCKPVFVREGGTMPVARLLEQLLGAPAILLPMGQVHHAPCTMLHTTCTMRHAPCALHHAPCNMRHAPYTMRHAPCAMHHTPCDMHHAPCTMHHAPCNMRHTPCMMHLAPCGGRSVLEEGDTEMCARPLWCCALPDLGWLGFEQRGVGRREQASSQAAQDVCGGLVDAIQSARKHHKAVQGIAARHQALQGSELAHGAMSVLVFMRAQSTSLPYRHPHRTCQMHPPTHLANMHTRLLPPPPS
eukprot:351538-Chlamydomonas_euryale.AAC.9